ncbi:MAG: PQQ-binding-like beta-propeller repeat protein [Pseudomonadota bacterium]|nr:PQQ-binding-like beta-propeller repeat protein [Pseudomonadota bacterium]
MINSWRSSFRRVSAVSAMALLAPLALAQSSPAFTPEQQAAYPTDGWISNGGSLNNQRYSPLDQINKSNIAGMKAEWRVHMNGSGSGPNHSGQAQPLFYDGILYTVTGENDVFATDIETGQFKWIYQANLDPERVQVCCGWVSRGLGMGDGQIYVGQLDAKLVALDQETGEVNWEIQAEDPMLGYSITAAPLYYNGMVIVGFAGGERAIRGRLKAFDAKTGELKWTFYTIPGPGEFGHDTWPQDNDAWKYGGAPIWQTPAVDPELGLIYFTTGNAGPDLDGSNRAGDNLFTVSMVALHVDTGEYAWHFQQVHHDIWDYDSPSPVVLFDANVRGEMRKGIAEASKSGFLYILDRVTGEPLHGIEERPVPQEPRNATAATQPWPIGDYVVPNEIDHAPEGFKLVNQGRTFTPFATEPVLYKPLAGVNWPPTAYDPEGQLMYICANDRIGGAAKDAESSEPTHTTSWMGGTFNMTSIPARGLFVAMDLSTHKIAWSQQWQYSCSAGSLVTAGGLVIHGRNDGRVVALDKDNGDKLWEFMTDAGVNGTASTFMHEGTQYIAIISAGSIYANGPHGDSIWLFSLKGEMEPVAPPAPVQQITGVGVQATPAAALVVEPIGDYTANLDSGRQIFRTVCETCHGDEGQGGHQGGVPLLGKNLTLGHIMTMATYGRNTMPGFAAAFSREQLQDVATFILDELKVNEKDAL